MPSDSSISIAKNEFYLGTIDGSIRIDIGSHIDKSSIESHT